MVLFQGHQLYDLGDIDDLFEEAISCVRRARRTVGWLELFMSTSRYTIWPPAISRKRREHLELAPQFFEDLGPTPVQLDENLGMVLREEGDRLGAKSKFEDGLRISRRRGDHFCLAYAILGLACLSADDGDWRRATELHGIGQASLDHIGHPWVSWVRIRDDSIREISEQLGSEEFKRLFAEGRGLAFDTAMQVALAERPVRSE